MAYAGFAIFLLGIIFIIVAPINKKKNNRCSVQAQGMLIDSWKRKHGHTYLYSYDVDGTEYQIESVNLSPDAKEIGDDCTIWYNPKKPQDAQPFHYESNKIYNIILIIGIVMLPLGFLLTVLGMAR